MTFSNKKKKYSIFLMMVLLSIVIVVAVIWLTKIKLGKGVSHQVKKSANVLNSGEIQKEVQAAEIKPNLDFKSLSQTDE